MTKLEQIEKMVAELGSAEFAAFTEWFEAFRVAHWNRQIEADVAAGKLDQPTAKALAEFRKGKTRPM